MDGRDWYDAMQVCLNGHQITDSAVSQPTSRQRFCENCGARTIDACQNCNSNIRGFHHMEGVVVIRSIPVPRYCVGCGEAYPWQAAALENLTEVLKESGLSAQDLEKVNTTLPDVVRNTPKTESASLKLKGILKTLGKSGYDIAIKVVTDVASETAKKTLGLG